MRTTIVRTGTANTASVKAALERAGAMVSLSDNADQIAAAQSVVLPGVGSFAAGMRRLRQLGLAAVLKERIAQQQPLLCICLGLQMLCKGSEESPGHRGLGILETTVRRLDADSAQNICVPQLGWNRIESARGCKTLQDGHAYYANSFAIQDFPEDFNCAATVHGNRFLAAIERGPLLACQFHPELSGRYGHELLQRWIQKAAAC